MHRMTFFAACVSAGAFAAVTVAAQTPATPPKPPLVAPGPNKIAFPADYMKGVLYGTVDRADNKQFRELYVSPPEAIDAAKKGEPLPRGTVLTLVQYRAQLDAQGNPLKGADGRFIKGDLVAYTVMEKGEGWGAGIPESIRNGEWEYQAFTAARAPNPKANLGNCYACHKPLDKDDFVFTYGRLKAFVKS
jgi:hypothetical protein